MPPEHSIERGCVCLLFDSVSRYFRYCVRNQKKEKREKAIDARREKRTGTDLEEF